MISLESSLDRFINDNNEDIAFILPNNEEVAYKTFNSQVKCLMKSFITHGIVDCNVLVNMQDAYNYILIFIALIRLKCVIIPCSDTTLKYNCNNNEANFIITDRVCEYKNQTKYLDIYEFDSFSILRISTSCKKLDATVVFLTSGTTNKKKAVAFSGEALFCNSKCLIDKLKIEKTDVLYTPISPMMTASLNTIFLPALLSGAKAVICDSISAGKIMQTVNKNNVSVLFLVPYMYSNYLRSPAFEELNWGNIKCCITSSSYMSPQVIESYYYRFGVVLCTVYCSSECGVITINNEKTLDEVKKTVGNPVDNVEVLVLTKKDDNTNIAKNTEVGEIIVKGPNLSDGYCNMSNESLFYVIYNDLYYRTGDCGYFQNGKLVLVGRTDDVVNIAGHLVYPQEIEAVLKDHKSIEDCLVYALLDENMNQILHADIVRANNGSIDKTEIQHYCLSVLHNYEVPTQIHFVERILYTDNGKKIRKRIRNE